MRHHDRHVRFAPIFYEVDEIYLNRLSLFLSAAETSAARGYNKPLQKKQGPHRVVGVSDITLRILQDGLKNTVSIHRATMTPNVRFNCNRTNGEDQSSSEDEARFRTDTAESHKNADNLCVVDKTVQQAGSGPRPKYVELSYRYSKADDITKWPYHIPQHFIDVY